MDHHESSLLFLLMYPGWSLRGWRAVGVGASRVGFGPLASFTSPYARAHDARTHPQKVCALRARSPPSRSPSRDGGERRNGCNCQVRQDASPRDLGTRRKSATAMGANLAVACRTSPAWSCRQVAHTPDRGRPPPPWSTPPPPPPPPPPPLPNALPKLAGMEGRYVGGRRTALTKK